MSGTNFMARTDARLDDIHRFLTTEIGGLREQLAAAHERIEKQQKIINQFTADSLDTALKKVLAGEPLTSADRPDTDLSDQSVLEALPVTSVSVAEKTRISKSSYTD